MDDEDTGVGRLIQDNNLTPEQSALEKEGYNAILDSIKELPEEYKTVITLRDIEGFSYQEVAEITECSLGTVKSRINNARKTLKEKIYSKLCNGCSKENYCHEECEHCDAYYKALEKKGIKED